MKNILEFLEERKSVRNFTGEKVSKKDLELIMKMTLRMPCTRGLQLLSFIVIDDKEKIEHLSKLCGNQNQVKTTDKFIIIVGDYSKFINSINYENPKFNSSMSFVDIAVDAGIAASTIDQLSGALGYGSTIIGGVHSVNPEAIIEYLKLPKYSFPMLGITLGHPTEEAKKSTVRPRVNYENSVFFNEYDGLKAKQGVLEYNETLNKWWEEKGLNMPSHLEVIKNFLNSLSEDKIKEIFKKQGLI